MDDVALNDWKEKKAKHYVIGQIFSYFAGYWRNWRVVFPFLYIFFIN